MPARRAILFAQVTSLLIAAAGFGVLAGWFLNIPPLTSLFLPGPTVKTNTGLSFACAAIANLLLISSFAAHRPVRLAGVLFATIPAVIGALTLSQHVVGWDLGIDQLLALEAPGALATASPNRLGPPASTAFLLIGSSLLLGQRSSAYSKSLSQFVASVTSALALLSLMGFAYGFTELYSVAQYTGIALATAIALFILSVSIQAGRPEVGLTALVVREDEVGVFARRLLPAAILMPFVIGWALARVYGTGIIDAQFAISTMALMLIALLVGVIWRTGTQLVLSLDERAQTARALAESARTLRESDQQKTEFLATLSHELRNPLAPIRFAVELLDKPATAARARQTIERQVQHLTRLIDDLLDLTRITRDKLELHVRPCELRQLVTDGTDAVRGEVERARHELIIDLPHQPVWLLADPDRVVQMLVNLLTNAIRYSDAGSRIVVGASIDGSSVMMFVRDSGRGLEPADLERVFERFVQVGKTSHGGLGLGLALVKALAELHGGSVDARSEGAGRGAEFRLRLPRATAPAHDSTAGPVLPIATRRILVVDDNRDAADMLASLLSGSGHEIRVAHDGDEALAIASVFRPQVGFLDIGMPGMDGYELATRLRSDSRLQELFLVAITGWGQEEDRQRALSVGFDAHLTKPADPNRIAALLAERFSTELT
ncbi:MAG: ATP-binding protein [Vicinamibacterales bacterium]